MDNLPALEEIAWLDPADIIREAFRRSRVVMMNEAHNGWRRCIRTRLVGRQVLPAAWESGARFLAMEALGPPGQEPETPQARLVVVALEEAGCDPELSAPARGYDRGMG